MGFYMNKATKILMSCLVLTFVLATTAWSQVTKVRDARTLAGVDTTVTIEVIMTTPDYGFNDGQFYVQDSTAGINVFYNDVGGANNQDSSAFKGWTPGDTLSITGSITEFSGTVQIAPDGIDILGAGNTRPAPIWITQEDLSTDSKYQGMIVKLADVSLADGETWPEDAQVSSGVNVDVVSGDSAFVLRIDRDESYFDGAPAPTERFNLLGVLGRFNSDVQILPFDSTDVANIVQVTFNVNTATMPDTLMEDHYIGVFGGVYSPTGGSTNPYLGQTIDWNSSTDLVAENQGGDYWTLSFDMAAGDGINYKFWAGTDANTPLTNGGEQGWESGGNNNFELPWNANSDSTAPLQWYETREAPFDSHEDSVTVYFRVNVGGQVQVGDFDPETGKVGVRGNPAFFDNPGDWSSTAFFLDQTSVQGDNYFYGGSAKMHKDSVANIEGEVGYKFVLEAADGAVTWESTPDEFTAIPDQDTTVFWKYFSGTPPTDAVVINTALNFEVSVGILEGLGYFNATFDTVFVTGTFNSWNNSKDQMTFSDVSGNYEKLNLPFTSTVDAEVLYKYYIKWSEERDNEESDLYLPGITHDGSGWEEPGVTGGADRSFIITDNESQELRKESYNGVPFQALMTSANVDGGSITVTFSVDMAPAVENIAQPFKPESDSVFLFVDTPFFALTNDITVPGDNGENFITASAEERERLRFTDDDEDMVYELELELMLPTLNHIGFRIAYGEPTSETGSLFANGGGFAAGRRHYQYVQPIVVEDGDDLDDLPDVSWPSTFTMPQLTWKADNLPWDLPPDYTMISTSNETEEQVNAYKLDQNYPNPFNPATNISFTLPNAADVNLAVYNMLGQKVATLISGKTMTQGVHSVSFDASSLASGIYIYRLEAGSFVSNKRMTLIK